MSAVDDILANLPIDQIASDLGSSPEEVRAAAGAAIPALLGGMSANAEDPSGAASLLNALDDHTGPLDPSAVDVADGEKALRHVFGDNTDQVVNQLGGLGGGGLMGKLLPMLLPLVMNYLAGRVGGGNKPSAAGAGGLGSILGEVLKGSLGGGSSASGGGGGLDDLLGGVLGGLLGGGTK